MSVSRGLGKGFGSLLPEDFDKSVLLDKKDRINLLSLSQIDPDPNQPRQDITEAEIKNLAGSIKRHGVLQPIIVTPHLGGKHLIVAGERRWRAAKAAGLKEIPALIRSTKELERLEIGLVENVQRVDLSPIEQAVSIAKLNEEFNVETKEIAQRLGKAHTTVINIVRLLQLPPEAKKALSEQKISEGHARSVLALKDQPQLQKKLLNNIIKFGWSVRQAEYFASQNKKTSGGKSVARPSRIISVDQAELLAKNLNTKIIVRAKGDSGKIEISYKTKTELIRILSQLNK